MTAIAGLQSKSVSTKALKAAAQFWFVVAITGQLVFAFTIASFYGLTATRGDFHLWSRFISHGLVRGDTMGNSAVFLHLMSAFVVMLSGAVQLIPSVRNRFPLFHRWNGRLYTLTAVTMSIGGLYMTWFRGSAGDASQKIGSTINVALILFCAVMMLRYAFARNFRMHRPWALRFFLVVSGAFFYRAVFFLSLIIFKGPWGFDPVTFTGPFPTIMSYANYLLPLGILEIYLRAQQSPGAFRRVAAAAFLFVITLAMGAGLFAVTMAVWVPDWKAALDPRKSIAEALSTTIASAGVDRAEQQYRDLKATAGKVYNFDESELNSLGYQLLNRKQYKTAIRIFRLNAAAYPHSSNVYDSLGEAYLDDGDTRDAIASYREALRLNPKNRSSAAALRKLGVS